jgi:hypothetical protein
MSDNAYKIVVDDYSCENKKVLNQLQNQKRHYLVKIILIHIKERD